MDSKNTLATLDLDRRTFIKVVGSGILIAVAAPMTLAQGRGRQQQRRPVSARLLLNKDGTISAMSGKVEEGQGPRAELTQAVAEELRVAVERVRLVMSDTDLVPDDGITAGSRTTPRNIPQMRLAAATARDLLTQVASKRWNVAVDRLEVRAGVISGPAEGQEMSYADLADTDEVNEVLAQRVRTDVPVTEQGSWQSLGKSVKRPNARDLVTGAHEFPSDITRPGMLYGRILRPPSYGATLESIDMSAAEAMEDVVAVRDGDFVGFAAPSSFQAGRAMMAVARTAKWKETAAPVTHETIYDHLKEHAETDRARTDRQGSAEEALERADKVLEATYKVAYIQHAPMEPRAGVAEWNGDRLTVWAGCDGPFRARGTLARQFGISDEQVRVIVPDMGGGFGGKHSAEAAIEAARLAKAAGKPVHVRWTRPEEFTWAYCRPAAVIECKAGLSSDGALVAWQFTNINAGGSAIETPYAVPHTATTSVRSDSPLPQGSYRALGSTGNNFARESMMDDLAFAAGSDPLEFRLKHLGNERIRTVLEKATVEFGWKERRKKVSPDLGIGLACGTEKSSVVAACVEVAIDRTDGTIKVNEICQAFECGPILNPDNLLAQVQGCIVMGLGGALSEELEFENGALTNARFARYRVPRFRDVPKIDVHLVENTEIGPVGAGETPIIAVAPAIGNAVFAATGVRLRSLPMRGV